MDEKIEVEPKKEEGFLVVILNILAPLLLILMLGILVGISIGKKVADVSPVVSITWLKTEDYITRDKKENKDIPMEFGFSSDGLIHWRSKP